MREFARLYTAIDETTRTNEKVDGDGGLFRVRPHPPMRRGPCYFLSGPPTEAAHSVSATRGRGRWRRRAFRDWLFEEWYHAVGDLAETIALLLPEAEQRPMRPLAGWVEERSAAAREDDREERTAQRPCVERLARARAAPSDTSGTS